MTKQASIKGNAKLVKPVLLPTQVICSLMLDKSSTIVVFGCPHLPHSSKRVNGVAAEVMQHVWKDAFPGRTDQKGGSAVNLTHPMCEIDFISIKVSFHGFVISDSKTGNDFLS
jgi:hypothetical protein